VAHPIDNDQAANILTALVLLKKDANGNFAHHDSIREDNPALGSLPATLKTVNLAAYNKVKIKLIQAHTDAAAGHATSSHNIVGKLENLHQALKSSFEVLGLNEGGGDWNPADCPKDPTLEALWA